MKTFALLLLCWLAPLAAAEAPSAAGVVGYSSRTRTLVMP